MSLCDRSERSWRRQTGRGRKQRSQMTARPAPTLGPQRGAGGWKYEKKIKSLPQTSERPPKGRVLRKHECLMFYFHLLSSIRCLFWKPCHLLLPEVQQFRLSWSTRHIFFHSMALWCSLVHRMLVPYTFFTWLQIYIWSLSLKETVFKVFCMYIFAENAEYLVFAPNVTELARACGVSLGLFSRHPL